MAKNIHIHIHTRDAWSPEAREAAAEARRLHAHHNAQSEQHSKEGQARGENAARPAKGSHAEAASHHGSAAFNHLKLAEAHEAGNQPDVEHYAKAAKKSATNANSASKKLASGKGLYPAEKENNWQPKHEGERAAAARRITRYLNENRGRR